MEQAITLITPEIYSTFDRMAKDIVQSGFTKLNEFQTKYIFLKGYELGVSPLQALDGINNIQGKPTCSPQFMLGLINRSGQLEDMEIKDDGKACFVTMKRKGRTAHTESFSAADAVAMKSKEDGRVISLSEKFNWRSMPVIMRKWRAVAACARIVFPDVIQGLYTAEEMGAEVNISDDGELVVISKTEPQTEQPAQSPPPAPIASAPAAPAAAPTVEHTQTPPKALETPIDANSQFDAIPSANGKAATTADLFPDDYSEVIPEWNQLKKNPLDGYKESRAFYLVIAHLNLFTNTHERDNSVKKHIPDKTKVSLAQAVHIMRNRHEDKTIDMTEDHVDTDELPSREKLGLTGS